MRGQGEHFAIYSRHSAALFLCAPLLILALFASCGLPMAEFLYPPSFASSGSAGLQLTHQTENIDVYSDYFLGYSIYYHLYGSKDAAAAALNALNSLAGTYENSPSSFMSIALSSTYNFRLMAKQDALSKAITVDQPMIDVKNNSTIQYFLDLQTFLINGDTSYSIVRNIISAGDYQNRSGFLVSGNYATTDPDYTGDISPTSVYIVAFAVGVGFSSTTLNTVYSAPDLYASTADSLIQLTLN